MSDPDFRRELSRVVEMCEAAVTDKTATAFACIIVRNDNSVVVRVVLGPGTIAEMHMGVNMLWHQIVENQPQL